MARIPIPIQTVALDAPY